MSKLIGIVNVTPDSFSDGGKFSTASTAFEHVQKLFDEGAYLVDIGAESTRPGATPLTPDEEWQRLEALCTKLKQANLPYSIDTRHAQTAKRALDHGATWLNDVSGAVDDAMIHLAVAYNVSLVAMHNLGIPARNDVTIAESEDVIDVIKRWAADTTQRCLSHGLAKDKLILDPGIGFGKTAEQSMRIVQEAAQLTDSNSWLFGHSRKSFYGLISDLPAAERDELTAQTSLSLTQAGVDYLRVHNVACNKRALEAA